MTKNETTNEKLSWLWAALIPPCAHLFSELCCNTTASVCSFSSTWQLTPVQAGASCVTLSDLINEDFPGINRQRALFGRSPTQRRPCSARSSGSKKLDIARTGWSSALCDTQDTAWAREHSQTVVGKQSSFVDDYILQQVNVLTGTLTQIFWTKRLCHHSMFSRVEKSHSFQNPPSISVEDVYTTKQKHLRVVSVLFLCENNCRSKHQMKHWP